VTGTTALRARNAGVDVMQIQKVLEKNPDLADVVSFFFCTVRKGICLLWEVSADVIGMVDVSYLRIRHFNPFRPQFTLSIMYRNAIPSPSATLARAPISR
jgi:hypothetical protein